MAVADETKTRSQLDRLRHRLDPRAAHEEVIAELDQMFRRGRTPDPLPSGFLPGRLLTTSVRAGADGFVRRVARMWMPWLGKTFDVERSQGVNVLTLNARRPMNMLWPRYEPVRVTPDGIEVFPFVTRIAPGELDPAVNVLKIDYDIDANPDFLIRNILDELVQIDSGLFLGKILYRWKGRFESIGFFSLESA